MDRTTTIDVTGMTCANCVAHVTEELEGVDGVLNVSVELRAGEPSPVTVVSNGPLDETAVRDAVDEAGYDVVAIRA
ncbi:heavy-metal-associated domain-containing protein [Occultella kanbiaonis]|uniref:heavy-metal-associated domain-containing protein n=1 Tax=Occultella kanbiaonis TaxID=2675754 RepID=UPI0013D1BAAE|nr:heavy metal-associated domain-containing protein [Occultella kanbiaonis]